MEDMLKDINCSLIYGMKTYIDATAFCDINAEELDHVANVIHHNAETEYYCTVTKAMKEADEESEKYGYRHRMANGRYGYEPDWGYDIMGYTRGNMRYSGNTRMGYKPYMDQEPYVQNYISDPNKFRSEFGMTYDDYRDAKRHYTDTHSVEDKKKMDEKTHQYLDDTMEKIGEMWEDADPALRSTIKADLQKFIGMM